MDGDEGADDVTTTGASFGDSGVLVPLGRRLEMSIKNSSFRVCFLFCVDIAYPAITALLYTCKYSYTMYSIQEHTSSDGEWFDCGATSGASFDDDDDGVLVSLSGGLETSIINSSFCERLLFYIIIAAYASIIAHNCLHMCALYLF